MRFLKYTWAEIANSKRFSLFFILNLALGLFGFLALEFFKDSLQATLQERSRAVLGADLAIQARREFTDDERKVTETALPPGARMTPMVEIFSMAAGPNKRSALVQIKAVTAEFPFYGSIETNPKNLTTASLENENLAWIYPELVSQIGVNIGDTLKLGDAAFKIAGVVENDSASGISTSMAPRVYVGYKQFPKTNLLRHGSIAWRLQLFHLPAFDRLQLDQLRDDVFSKFTSADVQVYTHENASEQMGRLLARLNDFLGLAAVVALFICALGIGFLCHTFLLGRLKSIAILVSLGMSHRRALLLHILQVSLLAAGGALVAGLLALLAIPFFQSMAARFVDFDIVFYPRPSYLLLTVVSCIAGSLLVLLPLILKIRRFKPVALLQDQVMEMPPWDLISLLGFLPLIAAFYGLSVWQMHSLKGGSIFFAAFLGAVLVFYGIGFAVIPLIKYLPRTQWLPLHWALRDLGRLKFATISCFLALSVSLLLLNLIPQIEQSIREEIKNPESSKLPGLFLFDIQEEQVASIESVIQKHKVVLRDLSPLVRARLTSVNGDAFDKGAGADKGRSREEEQEMRFRNRGFNLSYREKLSAAESILEGRDFSATAGSMAELSVEDGFADRLGLKIGDVLQFDVQSVPIEGRIVNLRKVRWTSFQPNFFVLFQPGFLEGAPKTFLATLPKLPLTEKTQLQNDIVDSFPNVSMIDIARLVERLQDIVFHISWSLKIMLILTLAVGFSVLFSIATQQAATRKWDIGLLKALGGSRASIAQSLLLQFSAIAFLASAFGFLLSLVFSYVISKFLFNNLWLFNWTTPALLMASSIAATALITWISVARSLRFEPRELLSRGS